jgi:hypothetical protein
LATSLDEQYTVDPLNISIHSHLFGSVFQR